MVFSTTIMEAYLEMTWVCYFTTKRLSEGRVPPERDTWRDLTGRWDRGGSGGLPSATSSGGAPGATTSGSLSGASTSGGPRHVPLSYKTTSPPLKRFISFTSTFLCENKTEGKGFYREEGRAWDPPLVDVPDRLPLVVAPGAPPLLVAPGRPPRVVVPGRPPRVVVPGRPPLVVVPGRPPLPPLSHRPGGTRPHRESNHTSRRFRRVQAKHRAMNNINDYAESLFQMCSENGAGPERDELDFEFLGNKIGEPYLIQTNVYKNETRGHKMRHMLWFDPTEDYHTYSIQQELE
ncbi:putative xyloglucan endotransglucosylase/hydrolase protein 8 [Glycine soja]|uniref:Putative xyloglucan endotransglucosylase/hydrolase protein 8 n=2 Tax=Glycine soja TaxID=3848 RepID=A0A445FD10_GLYSO|nr:putative xyloglucan endotransglucosylase/hydrolase protein 8 [Glycine soja]